MARTKQEAKKLQVEAVAGVKGEMVKIRKKHRYRPGTVALREIRRYQKSTEKLVQKLPMQRCIRELAQKASPGGEIRFNKLSLDAIHTAAEEFLIDNFKLASAIGCHGHKKTVSKKDLKLANAIINKNY
jgi:histone H3